jgi:hypothetical protein
MQCAWTMFVYACGPEPMAVPANSLCNARGTPAPRLAAPPLGCASCTEIGAAVPDQTLLLARRRAVGAPLPRTGRGCAQPGSLPPPPDAARTRWSMRRTHPRASRGRVLALATSTGHHGRAAADQPERQSAATARAVGCGAASPDASGWHLARLHGWWRRSLDGGVAHLASRPLRAGATRPRPSRRAGIRRGRASAHGPWRGCPGACTSAPGHGTGRRGRRPRRGANARPPRARLPRRRRRPWARRGRTAKARALSPRLGHRRPERTRSVGPRPGWSPSRPASRRRQREEEARTSLAASSTLLETAADVVLTAVAVAVDKTVRVTNPKPPHHCIWPRGLPGSLG